MFFSAMNTVNTPVIQTIASLIMVLSTIWIIMINNLCKSLTAQCMHSVYFPTTKNASSFRIPWFIRACRRSRDLDIHPLFVVRHHGFNAISSWLYSTKPAWPNYTNYFHQRRSNLATEHITMLLGTHSWWWLKTCHHLVI